MKEFARCYIVYVFLLICYALFKFIAFFSHPFCLCGFLSFFLSEFEIFPHFAFKYMNCRIYSSNKNYRVLKEDNNCHLQCYCRPYLFSLDFIAGKYELLYSRWKRVFIGTSACLHDFSHQSKTLYLLKHSYCSFLVAAFPIFERGIFNYVLFGDCVT